MQAEIVKTLSSTLKHDKQMIKEATTKLSEMRKQPGFYLTLMAIADDQQQSVDIRQSALANLKVSVERRWVPTHRWKVDSLISEGEKNEIRRLLLPALVRCNKHSRYLSLWRAIVKHVVATDYQTWLPIQQIAAAFKSMDVSSVLHYLLAVVDALEIPLERRPKFLDEVVAQLFPLMYDVLQALKTPEIIFLVTKILWKGFHMELGQGAATECFRWIPILLEIVQYQNSAFANMYSNVQKHTPQFFYYHSKKWAIRLLYRFIQRHANYKFHKQNEPFSKQFYGAFGKAVAEALLLQVTLPLIKKARYFLFKGLAALVETQHALIEHEAVPLLYTKLPPFMMLTPADQRLAREDPMELLKCQLDPVQMYTNTKRAAVDLWVSLNEIGSSAPLLRQYSPGKYLYQSMEFLRQKLTSTVLLEKQMSMYVLCQISLVLRKVEPVKALMPTLIEKYVIPEFANPEMFLRARAVEMFTQYGFVKFTDVNILKLAVEGIYKCLSQDPERIVNIKAACAFNSILSHKEAVDLVRPHLQQVLSIYIQLLEKNELEEIVESLEGIVTHFSDSIGPYAVQLVTHIARVFEKYCRHESEQSPHKKSHYNEESEIAATACLGTLSKIINSPLPPDAVVQIEELIIPVVSFAFTLDGAEYLEESLDMLASYLFKVQIISQRMWFFYPVIFYYLLGIDRTQFDLGAVPELNPQQRQIFANLGKPRLEQLHDAVPCIRLFNFKGRAIVTEATDFFGHKLLSLLFRLADKIYQANPDEFEEIQCEYATITAMFAHLLECFPNNSEIVGLVWNIIKINLSNRQEKAGFLTLTNLQLIAVCLYSAPEITIAKMEEANLSHEILTLLLKYQRKYLDEWHKQRMVLGLSGLLRTCPKPLSIHPHLPGIFKLVRDLTKDICNMRKEEQPGNLTDTETEEDSNQSANDQWDELHMINYDSCIGTLDEVAYLEASLTEMQQREPELFAAMAATLNTSELQQLSLYIIQAKQEFQRQQQELHQ